MRKSWTVRTCACIAGFLLVMAEGKPLSASESVVSPDLGPIPGDCVGFVTVRVADVLKKFGVKENEVPAWLVEIGKQLKLAPLSIDRITVVVMSTSTDEPLWIIQSAKPFTKADTARIVSANLPDAEEINVDGKILHVSSKTNRAIHVADNGLFASGPTEAVRGILKRSTGNSADAACFNDTLNLARHHDMTFWINPGPIDGEKPALIRDIEGVSAVLDFGKQISFEMRGHCGDEESVRPLIKPVRGGLNLLRGQLAMMYAIPDVSGLVPDLKNNFQSEVLRWVPWKLLRDVEKGMQNATVKAEGKTLTVSVSVPMEVTVLRRETARMVKYLSEKGTETAGTMPFGPKKADNSPRLMEADLGELSKRTVVYPPIPVPAPGTGEKPKPMSGPPAFEPLLPVGHSGHTPAAWESVNLTVANVRKETALLFELSTDGKMSFIQKVPAGEAVDVKTVALKRLIAVFPDKPAGESFEATSSATVWLLR